MPILPFKDVYCEIPKCYRELNSVNQFIDICDILYQDYFCTEDLSKDKEFVKLLNLKLDSEVYYNIHGQTFNSYHEFRSAILDIVTPEISLVDAISLLQNLRIYPNESILQFGNRVQQSLQTLNEAYRSQIDTEIPLSLKDANTRTAIDVFANSIQNTDTRTLLLARNFPTLHSAILFAKNRLNIYHFDEETEFYDFSISTNLNVTSYKQEDLVDFYPEIYYSELPQINHQNYEIVDT